MEKNEFQLERISPECAGISSGQVETCIRRLMHGRTNMNGFMAARNGKVFAETWWHPYGPRLVHSNHSFGKSYTATAIGIALKEKKLSLEERMVDLFSGEIAERGIHVTDFMRRVTIRHVLTMSSGHEKHPPVTQDWIGDYFRTPVVYEPGTRFLYNSSGSFLLGAVLLKKTGENLKEYLTPRLFEKIGIDGERFVWLKFGNGIDAEPGTFATTEDNLRLAMLYCNMGNWRGEQILDPDFVKDALSVQTPNPDAPEQRDGRCGYGYQLWACSRPGVYRFDGGQGQYGIIWPKKGVVVSIHEGAMMPYGPQETLDTVYECLLDHVQDDPIPEDEKAWEKLRKLQDRMAVPADEANALRIGEDFSGTYRIVEGEADPWMSVAPPGGEDFFRLFRTGYRNGGMQEFELRTGEHECVLTVDKKFVFTASMDGVWRRRETETVFPGLCAYCATARFLNADTLEIELHWLNSWAETRIRFERRQQGKLYLTTMKLRLNEEDNWLVRHARAEILSGATD